MPPGALQPNPVEGDVTHAATADFSAKQQKRINSNENDIKAIDSNVKKVENDLITINNNIIDIKTNYFTLENSPLWKLLTNVQDIKIKKWYCIKWTFYSSLGENHKILKLTKCFLDMPDYQKKINIESYIDIFNEKITGIQLVFNSFEFRIEGTYPNFNGKVLAVYEYQGNGTPI